MAARVATAFAHGPFFGVGSVVATSLVVADRKASAIAIMFTGLTVATLLGVPIGFIGQHLGWRVTFWAVAGVGVVALVIIATLVPADDRAVEASDWRADLAAILRRPVLLGLATTVLGFAGVFAVFTYIAPMLTRISGFSETAVSPILLVFGGGLVAGNLLGGRLADRRLAPTEPPRDCRRPFRLSHAAMAAPTRRHPRLRALLFSGEAAQQLGEARLLVSENEGRRPPARKAERIADQRLSRTGQGAARVLAFP